MDPPPGGKGTHQGPVREDDVMTADPLFIADYESGSEGGRNMGLPKQMHLFLLIQRSLL